MKKVGCLLVLLGLAATVGSICLFGLSIFRAIDARQAATVPLTIGTEETTELFTVDTDKLCMLGLKMDISSKSAVKDTQAIDKEEYDLRYNFPVSYTVLDADGKKIFAQKIRAAWNEGMRITTQSAVTASGGQATIEGHFEKFSVPAPGRVKVQIEVEPDGTYKAKARNAQLIIYDNVSRHAKTLLSGAGLICIAPGLVVVGLVIFVIGLATGRKRAKGNDGATA